MMRGKKPIRHFRVAAACAVFVAAMLGLSYAAVPFYSWVCKVTGFAGTTQVASAAPARILDRKVTIRFDSNIASDLPWRFVPKQVSQDVRVGEVAVASYEVENLSGRKTVGTATYNVTPEIAGGYFNKLQCFCFTEQALKPHEKRELTVSFFVDPDLAQEKEASGLDTITLSYTFYAKQNPQPAQASAQPAS